MEDLVWAKMKGFSPWPGRICYPPPELGQKPKKAKGPVRCIFFFGTCNYAWIEENNIKNYLEYKDQLIKSSKTAAFKEAVQKIEEYISDPVKYRCNAEPTATHEEQNNDASESVFDKLLEGEANHEENDRGDAVAAAVAAAVAQPSPKPVKKKIVSGLLKRYSEGINIKKVMILSLLLLLFINTTKKLAEYLVLQENDLKSHENPDISMFIQLGYYIDSFDSKCFSTCMRVCYLNDPKNKT
ncbi:cytokine-like nuclear factor N-PAC [Sitodiplosis mosellana]|uniref:cytokine-like nuclear factor N-PAC n=1 Tax=Sitodiplosis mosellana TaxID=263140 RepID=UPI002444CA9D|nr:cytokine-like nuclear factor N-PAC [Sitodiplosis mosellana]